MAKVIRWHSRRMGHCVHLQQGGCPQDTAIVQAAVSSSCTALDIRQTSVATWKIEDVEADFYEIEESSGASMTHLKHALWGVSLNGKRPFSLVIGGNEQLLRQGTLDTRCVSCAILLTMSHDASKEIKTHAVNLRVRSDTRSLIDRAARAHGKSRSDFMIEAARRAAEDALLDQTLMRVDQETYEHFLEVLDKPPAGKGFKRLMQANPPWEI